MAMVDWYFKSTSSNGPDEMNARAIRQQRVMRRFHIPDKNVGRGLIELYAEAWIPFSKRNQQIVRA